MNQSIPQSQICSKGQSYVHTCNRRCLVFLSIGCCNLRSPIPSVPDTLPCTQIQETATSSMQHRKPNGNIHLLPLAVCATAFTNIKVILHRIRSPQSMLDTIVHTFRVTGILACLMLSCYTDCRNVKHTSPEIEPMH